ncbi:hypothetical protein SCATT_02120 [Streptantibioticus cattleyicolor NRRL 8057 = DSM 46488]|uniref:Uncharacterized protein n=1 Tax=Streptantibioticus cattleyicolor (strain ATCC 35852 / DSM 46488 / JCM 4925 / NBRC 14057 / NRRL 8057) TaxID=1003195 RepID=G8WML4_STREN|nr:hypothetical protein SCATT_02120 [Streptantibioticus cattleyicolor NRRL 8057 = DSM 46488]
MTGRPRPQERVAHRGQGPNVPGPRGRWAHARIRPVCGGVAVRGDVV